MVTEPVVLEELPHDSSLFDPTISRASFEIGSGTDLFKWYAHPVVTAEDMRAFVSAALAEQAAGSAVPFATMDAR